MGTTNYQQSNDQLQSELDKIVALVDCHGYAIAHKFDFKPRQTGQLP